MWYHLKTTKGKVENYCFCSSFYSQIFFVSLIMVVRKLIFIFRSSHRRRSVKKSVLKNFTKFTRKHLCQSLFFNKVALLKTRLWHRCFPVNLVKFLRPPATSLKMRLWHRCVPVNFVRFLRAPF